MPRLASGFPSSACHGWSQPHTSCLCRPAVSQQMDSQRNGEHMHADLWPYGMYTNVYNNYTGWWFGTWILWLSIYWECHHPNWRTHIFQRGRHTTNQIIYIYMYTILVLHSESSSIVLHLRTPFKSARSHSCWRRSQVLFSPSSRHGWALKRIETYDVWWLGVFVHKYGHLQLYIYIYNYNPCNFSAIWGRFFFLYWVNQGESQMRETEFNMIIKYYKPLDVGLPLTKALVFLVQWGSISLWRAFGV